MGTSSFYLYSGDNAPNKDAIFRTKSAPIYYPPCSGIETQIKVGSGWVTGIQLLGGHPWCGSGFYPYASGTNNPSGLELDDALSPEGIYPSGFNIPSFFRQKFSYGQSGVYSWGRKVHDLTLGEFPQPLPDSIDPDLFRGIENISTTQPAFKATHNFSIPSFPSGVFCEPCENAPDQDCFPDQLSKTGFIVNDAAYAMIYYHDNEWFNETNTNQAQLEMFANHPLYLRYYYYTPSGQFAYSVDCPMPYPMQVPAKYPFRRPIPDKLIPVLQVPSGFGPGGCIPRCPEGYVRFLNGCVPSGQEEYAYEPEIYTSSGIMPIKLTRREFVNTPHNFLDFYANDILGQFANWMSGAMENPKFGYLHPTYPSIAPNVGAAGYYVFCSEAVNYDYCATLNGPGYIGNTYFVGYNLVKTENIFTFYYPDWRYLKASGLYTSGVPKPCLNTSGNMMLDDVSQLRRRVTYYTEPERLYMSGGIPIAENSGPNWLFFRQCQHPKWFIRNMHCKTTFDTFLSVAPSEEPLSLPNPKTVCEPRLFDYMVEKPLVDGYITELNFGTTTTDPINVELNIASKYYEIIGQQFHTNGSQGGDLVWDVLPRHQLTITEYGTYPFDGVQTQFSRSIPLSGYEFHQNGYHKVVIDPTFFSESSGQPDFIRGFIPDNPYSKYVLTFSTWWEVQYNCEKSASLLREFDLLKLRWTNGTYEYLSDYPSGIGMGRTLDYEPHLETDVAIEINDWKVPQTTIPVGTSGIIKLPIAQRVGWGPRYDEYVVGMYIKGKISGARIYATYELDPDDDLAPDRLFSINDYAEITIRPQCAGYAVNSLSVWANGNSRVYPKLASVESSPGDTNPVGGFSWINAFLCFEYLDGVPDVRQYFDAVGSTNEGKTIFYQAANGYGLYSVICANPITINVKAHVPDFIEYKLTEGVGTEIFCQETGRQLQIELDSLHVQITRRNYQCISVNYEETIETFEIPLDRIFNLGHNAEASMEITIPCGKTGAWF